MWDRNQIAARAAKELQDGTYVNLGIGIPTLVANYIPPGVHVTLQSENGMLGMGPFPFEGEEDPDLINAGKQTITELPQTAYFDSAQSFAMIRQSVISVTIFMATAKRKGPNAPHTSRYSSASRKESAFRARSCLAGAYRGLRILSTSC